MQRREIVNYGTPDGTDVDTIVLMPEPVADAPNLAPRKPRAQNFSLIAETDRGLADYLQLALDGRDSLRIGAETRFIHIDRKLLDGFDRLGNIA